MVQICRTQHSELLISRLNLNLGHFIDPSLLWLKRVRVINGEVQQFQFGRRDRRVNISYECLIQIPHKGNTELRLGYLFFKVLNIRSF